MLKINNISKTFNPGTVNEKKALSNLSLHLNQGDFVTILGSNGAGKSTLFGAIAGTFLPDTGSVVLDGKDITALSGAILAQYQKTADINLGTGMVIIGLASLIIGETLLPKGKLWMKALGAIAGSVLYRFIIAIALRLDLPSECLKLISATIVALAIGLPTIKAAIKPATKGGK